MASKILHIQGDTLDFTITVRNSDGTLVDLTGGSLIFTMSKWPDETPVLQKSCTIVDAVNGLAQVSATALEMDMEVGVYYWEIQITWPGGDVTTTPMQTIEILSQLTQ